MIICVANSKDQTKKLKHKGPTGSKEREWDWVRSNHGQWRERNGKKKSYIPLPHVQNVVKEEKDMLWYLNGQI